MPVGLHELPALLPVSGIECVGLASGIKSKGGLDLALFQLSPGTITSAVFTQNLFCAAPVRIAQSHLRQSQSRYLLINSGNANAGTGELGYQRALETCQYVAQMFDCAVEQVLPFSTGVIGVALQSDVVKSALPNAQAHLGVGKWAEAAHAIMTTDTVAKGISEQVELNGQIVTVTGISKGSGMIRPDMATMLAFIATDASVSQLVLDEVVRRAADNSFNRITVDGDTSTNDACVLMATGRSGAPIIDTLDSAEFETLYRAVEKVCLTLAQAIVRDGEGATKFITVRVISGRTQEDCSTVAYSVAHSPLVKTALFASDPNWGRILAAVGRAGVDLDIDRLELHLDEVCIVRNGGVATDYTEDRGQRVMSREEITITVDLAMGDEAFELWTTDFSYDYVRINAAYRS